MYNKFTLENDDDYTNKIVYNTHNNTWNGKGVQRKWFSFMPKCSERYLFRKCCCSTNVKNYEVNFKVLMTKNDTRRRNKKKKYPRTKKKKKMKKKKI